MSFHRASVLAILMLSLGSAVALADSNPLSPQLIAQNQQAPRQRGKEGLFQQLNLSQTQMQQMQQIRAKYKDQLNQQRQAVRQARQELTNLMAGSASADQIRAKHRQMTELRGRMEETQFNSMLEMREILTPEQRTKLSQLMQQRRGMRGKHGDHKQQHSFGL